MSGAYVTMLAVAFVAIAFLLSYVETEQKAELVKINK